MYFALIRLDDVFRTITGVVTSRDELRFRPAEAWRTTSIRYEGEPLSNEEEQLVRDYIEWIRWRRSYRASG